MTTAAGAAGHPLLSRGYRTWLLALLLLVSTLNFTDRLILTVLAQAIKEDLLLSDFQLGLLGGLTFAILYTVFGIPIARLADRGNRVTIIATATFVWSAMTALGGAAANFWQLALTRMGVGLGEAGFLPPSASLLADHFPARRRASAMAIIQLGSPLSLLVGTLLAVWIADQWNWRVAFVAVGLPGIFVALLVRYTLREPPRGLADGTAGAPRAAPTNLAGAVRLLAAKPAFRHILIAGACGSFCLNAIGHFLPAFLYRVHELSLAQAGLIFALAQASAATVGHLLAGFGGDRLALLDRRWYAWVPAAGLLVAAPAYALGFLQADLLYAVPLIMLGSVAMCVYYAPTLAMVQNMAASDMRASAVAIFGLVASLIGIGFGPTLVGLASDLLAAAAYDGDFTAACLSGPSAAAPACLEASAVGLQRALVLALVVFLWGAVHFLLAARTLVRDEHAAH